MVNVGGGIPSFAARDRWAFAKQFDRWLTAAKNAAIERRVPAGLSSPSSGLETVSFVLAQAIKTNSPVCITAGNIVTWLQN